MALQNNSFIQNLPYLNQHLESLQEQIGLHIKNLNESLRNWIAETVDAVYALKEVLEEDLDA